MRRADAASSGFRFKEPQLEAQQLQEFGEFVVGQVLEWRGLKTTVRLSPLVLVVLIVDV